MIEHQQLLHELMAANAVQLNEDTLAVLLPFARKYQVVQSGMLIEIADMMLEWYAKGATDAASNFLDVVRLFYVNADR